MPTIIRITCPGCDRQVPPRAINQEHGVCGSCVAYQRNVNRGYIPPSVVKSGTCLGCGGITERQTMMQVLDGAVFRPIHFDCLAATPELHPTAAAYAAQWYAELAADHARQDAAEIAAA